jgi:hypothetical protein
VDFQNPFRDVASDAYYYEAVRWAVMMGITDGVSDTAFAPDQTVTRAQALTMLYRYAGSPPAEEPIPFRDVPADAYYHDAAAWGWETGVVQGTGGNRFSPDAPATREQLAVVAANCAKQLGLTLPPVNEPQTFADAARIHPWASEAISKLQQSGVLSGYPDGTFRPQNAVTSEEACKILCEGLLFREMLKG